MKRKTKSILEELNSISESYESSYLIENTGINLIAGISNLIQLIKENYDEDVASDLEKRLINSIRSGDESKFSRGIESVRKKTNSKKL
jgi:hypothetical protein